MCATCKRLGIRVRAHFPGYPSLKRVSSGPRGRMTLLEVTVTSDGFLLGTARIGTGRDAYVHSVFLGRASNHPTLADLCKRRLAVLSGRLTFQVVPNGRTVRSGPGSFERDGDA